MIIFLRPHHLPSLNIYCCRDDSGIRSSESMHPAYAVSEHLLLQRRPNAAQTYVTEHLLLQPHELYQNELASDSHFGEKPVARDINLLVLFSFTLKSHSSLNRSVVAFWNYQATKRCSGSGIGGRRQRRQPVNPPPPAKGAWRVLNFSF